MGKRYLMLGSGRQGVAAAYDLARFGDAEQICLLDMRAACARFGARRVNELVGKPLCISGTIDAGNTAALVRAMRGFDAAMSAVPYYYNVKISKAALRAGTPLCDLGGNAEIVKGQLALHARARKAGVAIVPDCGLAPGMANILAVYVFERFGGRGKSFGKPASIALYCGGLPKNPHPPLDYQLVFSLEGLLNEYEGRAVVLRDGRIEDIETLTEIEALTMPAPVGRCEAFVTSGGTSWGPQSFKGKVRDYAYKTIRYPGHVHAVRAMRELGLFSKEALTVNGKRVAPRDVFKAAVTPRLSFPGETDVVVLRVACRGERDPEKGGRPAEVRVDLVDEADPKTGFSAMERTTGFGAAIVQIMLAQGDIAPGARAAETAVPATLYMNELKRRGFKLSESARGG